MVAKEINGYEWKTRKQVLNFTKLADDGSTALRSIVKGIPGIRGDGC